MKHYKIENLTFKIFRKKNDFPHINLNNGEILIRIDIL